VLLAAAAAAAAGDESPCLAVRPLGPGTLPGVAARSFDMVLAGLPVQPVEVRALLASRSDGGRSGPAGATGPRLFRAWRVLRFADAGGCSAALAALARRGDVVAERVRAMPLCGFAGRLAAGEIPANVRQVRAPEAIAAVVPDTNLVVAVIDTGCDLLHPDLARRIWNNDDPPDNARTDDDGNDQNADGLIEDWERDDDDDNGYVDDAHGFDFADAPGAAAVGDFRGRDPDPSDEHGHGTHVAGIIAADGALTGVAPFVRLMPVRAAYTTVFGGGVLETDDAAAAIAYAADNGAHVLNLSWGDREESRLVRDAVTYAVARGVVVVAAGGNGTTDAPHWPSGTPGVIAVGSVDGTGTPSLFSNFGPGVALYAPGEIAPLADGGIESLAPGGGRARRRGTSMAAPHVAGIAAILLSRADRPDAERVRALLLAGARRVDARDWSPELSHGTADALASVESRDDLLLAVQAPPRAGGRRLVLAGTVLGGDLIGWRLEGRAASGGPSVLLAPWTERQVAADTLADIDLGGLAEGDWEWIVSAETGAGAAREAHGLFAVDRTPPQADTLYAVAAWRGAAPRWLVGAASNEAAALRVVLAPGDTLHVADAGLARRMQVETEPLPGAAASWTVDLVDAYANASQATLARPPALQAWPQGPRLAALDSTRAFLPERVWGTGPGGTALVWGQGLAADTATTAQAWSGAGGRLALQVDTGLRGRPAGFGDTNGDGAGDLLLHAYAARPAAAVWLVTQGAGTAPDSVLVTVPAERALGLFQLDDDAPLEALLSSRDTLFVHDDAATGAARRVQALVDPWRSGFLAWGADAAAGDLDGDGRLEIACGDAEGAVTVFEQGGDGTWYAEHTAPTGGVYAYDLEALPEGGFLVGRRRDTSVAGGGFEVVPYEFLVYAPEPPGWLPGTTYPFLAPAGELRAASTAAPSPATGDAWLALVRGGDLYLLRGTGASRTLEAHWSGAAGRAPALLDADGDGVLDLVLGTPGGAVWLRVDEGAAGPHDLVAEPLGATRVRLAWVPRAAAISRVRRGISGIWETLGETAEAAWIDSTLVPGQDVAYEVQAIQGGEVRGTTNRVGLRARPRPRLLAVEPWGAAALRVRGSNPFGSTALAPWRWRVAAREAGDPIIVQHVALQDAGRTALLLLDHPPRCGALRVRAVDLRDDQGAALDPAGDAVETELPCAAGLFAVVRVRIEGGGVRVEFSRAPDLATLAPERFELSLAGVRIPVSAVLADGGTGIRLEMAPGVVLAGRGTPYVLRVDSGLRAAVDGAPLAYAATEHRLYVEGSGASKVTATPNPVRPGDGAVVFAEAAAATQVEIFDLEGERVRRLAGARGGGLRWDLRDARGVRVAPGAYFWVARDAGGRASGRLVVLR
jgi:hypothetical protein